MSERHGCHFTAALTIVLLLSSAPGLAAQTSQMPPAGEAAFLAGPVTLYPSIVLRDVGFDSNIRNDAEAQGGLYAHRAAALAG